VTNAAHPDLVTLQTPEPSRLLRFEIWSGHKAAQARLAKVLGGTLPGVCKSADLGASRVIWVEQNTWLVRTSPADGDQTLATLTAALGKDGSATDMSGALRRLRISGPGWRTLLTIGSVFDAESPAFAPGSMAGTIVAHSPVRYDVISEDCVDAYTPPSYAPDLFGFWCEAAERLAKAR
jgi:heterotetrameric sarcosine oxidase gamma subunit